MTGWGTAFKGALKIVVFTIIWAIIGGILIGVGAGMAGIAPAYLTTTAEHQAVGTTALIGGFILIIIGAALIGLGGLASFLKVSSEIYADEVLAKSAYMRQYYQQPPQYAQYPQQPPPGQPYPR